MEKYRILYPESRGIFQDQISGICATLKEFISKESSAGRYIAYSKVFLSDIHNQYTVFKTSLAFCDILSKAPCSIIGQAPLKGYKVAVLVKTTDLAECLKFHSIRLSDDEAAGESSYLQTLILFEKYINYLDKHGLDMKTHLVRTWIYIKDIDVNYSGVVNARNDIFAKYGLTADTHFVASTGIGGDSQSRRACVAMDFLTYPHIVEQQKKYLKALDYLDPANEYGVAFERATRLSTDSVIHYYVSGTASIDRHGNVLHIGDVNRQAERLIENIKALLAEGDAKLTDICYLIVYLRDISDYQNVDFIFHKHFPNTPYIIVHAKVCRPEWLIEAECIAEKNAKTESPC